MNGSNVLSFCMIILPFLSWFWRNMAASIIGKEQLLASSICGRTAHGSAQDQQSLSKGKLLLQFGDV